MRAEYINSRKEGGYNNGLSSRNLETNIIKEIMRSYQKDCKMGSRNSFLRTILLRSFIRSLATIFSFPFLLALIFIMIEVNPEEIGATLSSTTTSWQNKELHALETFKNGFCGIDAKPNLTHYVTEYVLPQSCEMPLGIDVDIREDKVWYVSTKHGILGSYDFEEDKFNEEVWIPT